MATQRSLDSLLSESEVVFNCLPYTASTKEILGHERLSSGMAPGAFLINVGRGSTVCERSVAQALESGRLGGYAADVFAFEDWRREDRPAGIPQSLLEAPNCLLTSHIGSAVSQVRERMELESAVRLLLDLGAVSAAELDGVCPETASNEQLRCLGFETF